MHIKIRHAYSARYHFLSYIVTDELVARVNKVNANFTVHSNVARYNFFYSVYWSSCRRWNLVVRRSFFLLTRWIILPDDVSNNDGACATVSNRIKGGELLRLTYLSSINISWRAVRSPHRNSLRTAPNQASDEHACDWCFKSIVGARARIRERRNDVKKSALLKGRRWR